MRNDLYERVVRNIRRIAARDGKSNSILQISKRVLIPQSTLHDKINDPRKFTLEDLQKISSGLDADIADLFSKTS